jgi:orotidine-5'-phosphate decarboxylase
MWKVDKGHSTGTTTASYVSALTWSCAELREKTIHLVNTHATLSMYFKLLARYHEAQTSGKEDELVAATSLAAGEDTRLQYDRQYHELVLQVIDNSGHATYEVNYSGQGA